MCIVLFFFFNDTATTEIYTLSLHDALPIFPDAEECCGFGGTFAVKNDDTSVAMGADKARHVRETGAEVLVAGDNSCLMHVGGVLSRQQAGVRVVHLAEVLASTEESAGVSGSHPAGEGAA